MSCCGSCAHGRKCKGKKKRKNPNFLYMPNRRRRKNPEASTNFIYEANGKRRTHRMKIRGRKRPSQRYKAHLAAKQAESEAASAAKNAPPKTTEPASPVAPKKEAPPT